MSINDVDRSQRADHYTTLRGRVPSMDLALYDVRVNFLVENFPSQELALCNRAALVLERR